MQAVGLITEYNPFHNGHLHHLRASRQKSGAEVAVAIMSGHFLQRGMPALVDKWVRTEMALAAGVDVVLELPFPWACNSAPHFAAGAVRSLDACGGVTALAFGSEAGALEPLQRCAERLLTLEEEPPDTVVRLRRGVSYPAARAARLSPGEDAPLLQTPNNILAIEYLKALRQQQSPLRPLTVLRLGPGYHDQQPVGCIASATGIRALHRRQEEILPYLPEVCQPPLLSAFAAGAQLDEERLWQLVAGRLLGDPSRLDGLYQLEAGIAARLCDAARRVDGYEALARAVKPRHLTLTRIQRLLAYLLLDVTADAMDAALAAGPPYLRLLGHSPRGRSFLAATRKERQLPLLANLSRASAQLKKFYGATPPASRRAAAVLELDLRATRIYTLLLRQWHGDRHRDFFEPIRQGS